MEYTNLSQALEAFRSYQQTLGAYNHAMGVLYLDAATAAPSGSYEGRGKTMEVLSSVVYNLTVGEENGVLFDYLTDRLEELTPLQKRKLSRPARNMTA